MTPERVRVYLPLSAADLACLAGPQGCVDVPTGYAATAALQRAHPGEDVELMEHAAFTAAAAAATAAVGAGASAGRQGSADAPARRVVGAADVDRGGLRDDRDPGDPARVRLLGGVPLERFAAFHVDEQPGAVDLSWYDLTELEQVVALVRQA